MIQVIPIVMFQLLRRKWSIGFFISIMIGRIKPISILIIKSRIWMPKLKQKQKSYSHIFCHKVQILTSACTSWQKSYYLTARSCETIVQSTNNTTHKIPLLLAYSLAQNFPLLLADNSVHSVVDSSKSIEILALNVEKSTL